MKILFLFFSIFGFITLGFTQDDEASIEELEKLREVQQRQAEQIEQVTEPIAEVQDDLAEFSQKALTIDDIMSEKFQKMIEKSLKNNPLREMDRETIKQMLREKVKGHPMEKVFKALPVTLDITVDLMKDDKALLGLIRLAGKKKELMNFTGIWVVLFLSFWMLKKRIAPKTAPFVRRLIFKSSLSVIGTTLSFSIFYFMFKDEIGPMINIITNNLWNLL